MAWYPNGVRTGSGDTSPFFSSKTACSKAGTISPLPTSPRSPPLSFVPGSSDTSRASLAKSSPALARRMTSAIFAFALSSASLPPVSLLFALLHVGLLDLGVRDLHAAAHRVLDLAPRQPAAHLVFEPALRVPETAQHLFVAFEREAATFLEGRKRVDLGVQLLVGQPETFPLRLLDGQRLQHQVLDDLLRQPHALGHLGAEAITHHLRVHREIFLVAPLIALDGDLLAIDAGHAVAGGAAITCARPENEERRDERGHDHEQADLQGPAISTHKCDHLDSLVSRGLFA